MIKKIVLMALVIMVLGGCTAKEFNEGVESITGDISETFDEGRDKTEN